MALGSVASPPQPLTPRPAVPWYREVTRQQWLAFLAAYLGWVLDAFDFTILTFLLVDIQRSFTVNAALAGALGTITLIFRVAGGIAAGTAADRWGRKGPLMFSILWYSVFAFLSGFSTSYRMLFALRAIFGIGMGGVWAAAMPLTIEHWPAHLRGTASGMLQSGYSFGFLLSSIVFQFVYPIVNRGTDIGWRVMLWIGVLPAFLLLFMMRSVAESPVWLERQRHLAREQRKDQLSIIGLFAPDVIRTTIHTALLMGAFLFMYHSITFWYPTFITRMHRPTLPFLFALNLGGVTGALAVGRWSEGAMGRRGAATLATLIGMLTIPIYVWTDSGVLLWTGALLMGFFGAGNFGVVPAYLNERFPTVVRAVGAGFAYHVGAGIGSLTPTLVGRLQDLGFSLPLAMTVCIAASGTLVIVLMWLGPETRGREFHAHH
ncbi:MAG TPA: MFS transporter [Vicinamibacterales bacterium]|nr:MFS transporter [Vicinamibacterales bacterium]